MIRLKLFLIEKLNNKFFFILEFMLEWDARRQDKVSMANLKICGLNLYRWKRCRIITHSNYKTWMGMAYQEAQ